MTASPKRRRLRFTPSWRLSLFVAFFLPIVASLSVWQWQRAADAAAFETELERMAAAEPASLAETVAAGDATDLRPVVLTGRFIEDVRVWLDNRTWRGRAGYELLVPFEDPAMAPEWILVNLGWVAADRDRGTLPEVQLPSTPVVLTGQLAPERPPPAVFGPVLEVLGDEFRVQRVELKALAEAMDQGLHERIVVADSTAPGVQTWNFRPARLTAARHRGYALQWLGLGLVLVVGWCLASFHRDGASA